MNEEGEAVFARVDRWDEALTWYSILRDAGRRDLTGAVGRKWQQWYSDRENQRVFDDVSRLLACGDSYGRRIRPSKAEIENDCYDLSIPITEWLRPQAPRETQKRRPTAGNWRQWLSAGIGVAAITVLFALLPVRIWSSGGGGSPVVYHTDVGELKDIHLSDGSSIILGGLTKVSVALSARRRSVTLVQGQAWFKVAHDLHWPFMVSAGGGTITDVGTAFLVTRESDRVVVTVTDGTVEVSARPSMWSRLRLDQGIFLRSPVATRVSRGEQLTFGNKGALSRVRPTDTHDATAWTHGRLTFHDQPLRYVIEAINRYSSQHILVSPAAGRLRLSGIAFENDIPEWLQTLEIIFPVTVQQRSGSLYIQMRRTTQSSVNFDPRRTGK